MTAVLSFELLLTIYRFTSQKTSIFLLMMNYDVIKSFGGGDPRERDHLEDLGVDGR
jgi:hypothetical protein